uniref:DNA replication licensing factor MCM2 n=1 Tax=Eutreptiella gymnastica TaxID=73025 RepID=A0A7S1JI13_9EUGL
MPADRDEVEEIVDELDHGDEEPDDGEDLVGDDMMRDYAPEPELDRYSDSGLDDEEEFEELSVEARRAAEREIDARARDKRRRAQEESRTRKRFRAGHLLASDDEGSGSEAAEVPESETQSPPRRRPAPEVPADDDEEDEDAGRWGENQFDLADEDDAMQDEVVDIADVKGPLSEWIVKDKVRRGVASRFQQFLTTAQDGQVKRYRNRITQMVNEGRHSLEVSFDDLSDVHDSLLAIWVSDAPAEMLEIFDEVATSLTGQEFPEFEKVCHSSVVHVRITDLPICDPIRDIRQVHLNALIKVAGVVTRRSVVFPQLQNVVFDCLVCGFAIGPIVQRGEKEVKPHSCPQCQQRNAFKVNFTRTIFRNYQTITLQESPGQVPAGRLPRSVEVVLLDDLIDSTKPGEEVEVTGIYKNNFDPLLNHQHGFPVFATNLEANYVERKTSSQQSHKLTDEEKEKILRLSQDPKVAQKLIKSMAPAIHGHEDIKLGLLLSLMSGQEKEVGEPGQHKIRGDINVLLLGDPGCAKSQFLKYVEKTAHRSVFTTGRGSTAVGLTAAVHPDPGTGEWTLEGGALVIADRGVCMIDEFDKMSDGDRTSIHEAMEQQTISISKAGIVTTLQARCAVIAAANPVGGNYDESLTFEQNVDLTQPILQRFDLLYVIRDEVDPIKDTALAEFVCRSHVHNHPETIRREDELRAEEEEAAADGPNAADGDVIPQDMVRKYIMYARAHVRPTISAMDENKLAQLYADLRKESQLGGGVTMSVRHIESIIRLTEAHAKLHLRDYAREDDMNAAIRLFLGCFVNTQKYQAKRAMTEKFARYLVKDADHDQLLLHLLRSLVRQAVDYETRTKGFYQPSDIQILMSTFQEKAEELELFNVEPFLASPAFRDEYRVDRQRKVIVKQFRSV